MFRIECWEPGGRILWGALIGSVLVVELDGLRQDQGLLAAAIMRQRQLGTWHGHGQLLLELEVQHLRGTQPRSLAKLALVGQGLVPAQGLVGQDQLLLHHLRE